MRIKTFSSSSDLYSHAAQVVADFIKEKNNATLALAAGQTPTKLYEQLIKKSHEGLELSKITTFNLDEFLGIPKTHHASFASYMHDNFLNSLHIPSSHIHSLDGMTADWQAECENYEREIAAAGGLDLAILGLGKNGHIAFNEPGTPLDSRTRKVELTFSSREANKNRFPNEDVPKYALTMGLSTILSAKHIILMVTGNSKAEAFQNCFMKKPDLAWPGSCLQNHPNTDIFIDKQTDEVL